jgi:hypothetical protein
MNIGNSLPRIVGGQVERSTLYGNQILPHCVLQLRASCVSIVRSVSRRLALHGV